MNNSKLTQNYLNSATILIVDQNSSARVGLKKILITLGAALNQVHLAASFSEAEELIVKLKPTLVFCDYQIGGKFGLDLLQKQRQEYPKETNHCLFILVTGNTSQSAVAQAAEEDIDAYILKPYTMDNFTIALNRAIQVKIEPSEYLKLIQQGKDSIERQQLDEAMSFFEAAMKKETKPALACFYEGLVHFKKSFLEGSQSSYQKGLSFNKIHYKCLVGLFDLLMSLGKHEAAYEIVQKIVRFFPANPKRLSTVLKLAIQTQHYSDIDTFYQEFLKIEERGDDLIKCVCAALIICGKHFFEINDPVRAIDLIQKASVTSAGRPYILKKSIEVLVQNAQLEEAKSIFKRFTAPSEDENNYATAALLIASKEATPEIVAGRGLELLKRNITDLSVYLVSIEALEKLGKKEQVEELKLKAQKIYPDLSNDNKDAA